MSQHCSAPVAVVSLLERSARASEIAESETPSWKPQPDQVGEVCPPDLSVALNDASSMSEAVGLVLGACPEWSVSRAARFARRMWDDRGERSERGREYARADAAPSDAPFRGRDPRTRQRDITASRALHNAAVIV